MTIELTDEELQTRLGRVPQAVIDRFAARIRAEAIEYAASFIEAHSCVSTCCEAQPGGDTAKELADCLRDAESRRL
jgi:hypothetical protein